MVGTVSFFVLLSVSCCKGTLYIPTGTSRWSGYNNGCIPATPKVKVGTDMNYYLDESLDEDLPFNDKVWVGYYQVVRVFEYIGCVTMESIVNNGQHPFVKINGDPGHCFPGCGDHTIVGVTKTKCYCLGLDIMLTNHTQTGCTHKCNHPIVSCGYDSTVMKYAFLSIYKMNPRVTASAILNALNEGHNCLSLNHRRPKSFSWENCLFDCRPMCTNGGIVQTLNLEHESQQYFTWIGAANICFTNRMFPTYYSNAKDVHQHGGSQLWTGMFKTKIVYKSESNIPAERRQDQKFYGYLTRNVEDGVKLQFTETKSYHRRLCYDGKNGKNEKSTSPTKSVSSTGTITTSSNPSSTTININGKEVENENSTRSTVSPTTIDGNGSFYLSTENSTWLNASSLCSLGTPNINRTSESHYADISDIELRENERVWTGFYKTMKILEYIDCMHLDDIVRLGAKPLPGDIDGSPSACIGQCENSQLFGVSISKCFCLKQKSIKFRETSKKTKCTTQCQYPQGVTCGFENDTDTYLSVYKLNENVLARSFKESTLEVEKENHCLAYNLKTRYFTWENCKQFFKHLCYTDHGVVKIPNVSTWSDAANNCFAIKNVPASINNSVTVDNNDIEYLWTGVIRLNIVYKIDNYNKDENNEEIKYGVLSKEPSGRYLLTFENVRERRRSLCHKRMPGSKILSIVPVLITVAIAISIIGVIAIACRIMVKYKRRLRKAKNQVVRTSTSDNHYVESSFTVESTEEHPCHQYFVVEPHEKKVTTPANTYNKPFRLNGIARGATITNGSQMHMNDTDNQQYNTLSSCKVGKSIENDDVVYNTLDLKNERSVKYTDNVYDSFKGHKPDTREQCDVEYNRLDAKIRGNMHTDNVYNSFADKGKQIRFEYNKLND